MGNDSAAWKDAERALQLAPDQAESWSVRGKLYAACGEWEAACRDYQRAFQLDPARPGYSFQIGKALWEQGAELQAGTWLEQAIILGEQSAEGFIYRTLALQSAGRLHESLADLSTALRLDADLADA